MTFLIASNDDTSSIFSSVGKSFSIPLSRRTFASTLLQASNTSGVTMGIGSKHSTYLDSVIVTHLNSTFILNWWHE
jgi:hypothetical protein